MLGDYLAEGEVARHDTARVAKDLLELASQPPAERRDSPARPTSGPHASYRPCGTGNTTGYLSIHSASGYY